VLSSVLEKTEVITDSWQGIVPEPYYDYYVNGIPAPYNSNLSYMRGAVVPYTEYAPQFQVDSDDGSPDLGIIFKRSPVDSSQTVLVSDTITVQTAVPMSSPYVSDPTPGRPEVAQFSVLSIQQIDLPKEGVSILQLSNAEIDAVEYVRVISVTSNVIRAIRNYYPDYSSGTLPAQWPAGTTAKACVSTGYPEPSVYDPDWAVTKATMLRFFQLMGYSPNLVRPFLIPRYSGERTLLINSLPLSPVNGYANLTTAWPIEFNNPSTIIANTHTWQYAGYLDYSRGLPKYQVNEISRKLSYDFLSTTSWGGRLTVMGANETGQLIFLGPIKEAITGQFYTNDSPLSRSADRLIYTSPENIVFPNPVLVYSTDDISGYFDNSALSFPLTRGSYPIPSSQLLTLSIFVTLGGVVQKPGEAYAIQGESQGQTVARIVFSEAPPSGTSCDIRVITTEDNQETVEVVSLGLNPPFDGIINSFTVNPTVSTLDNNNSFLFLGGVEQIPVGLTQTGATYSINEDTSGTILTFIGETPEPDTVLDFRAIVSGRSYRNAGVSTVFVAPTDDISPLFNNSTRTFPLTVGGEPLDPDKVNAQNMFVSLGGVMQIPVTQLGDPTAGVAYTVQPNPVTKDLEITFDTSPSVGTTCNIRVITSDEYLTCPLPPELLDTSLKVGPGVEVNSRGQIIGIDPSLIES
jgi:hypothetical protein